MNEFSKYNKAVDYIEGLSYVGSKGNYMVDRSNPEIYLKRMRYFLELIDNPDREYKIIHITGTSGKGTVTNMLQEVLRAAGKKVGSFTSPFVTTTIEKFKVNDLYISPEEFVGIVEYLKPYIEEVRKNGPYGPMSYFEVCLAIAFIYFKNKKCEWVVLEVGLGGRYDATNVIERPVITAITNIDYDHTEILGKTLNKIANDKGGIIKEGSEFFTTENRVSIIKVFKKICKEKRVKMHTLKVGKDYNKNNANLVTAISRRIGVKESYINYGIACARLQCRFEVMQDLPKVVVDGAHNKAKIKSTIDNLKKIKYKKLYLILSISQNKDHLAILKQIVPKADYFYVTKFKNDFRKSAEPKDLVDLSKKYFKKETIAEIFNESSEALNYALKNADVDDLILVSGSFFLAGEVRKRWIPEEWILKHKKPF